jgi:hypothetical protein
MSKRYAKKAVRPILNLIAERINMEIMPEFGVPELMFKFDDYDLDEDIKRHQLYESQIRMGIKTAEMVAEEEDIDVAELTRQKEEQEQKMMEREQGMANNGFGNKEKDDKPEVKSKLQSDLEKALVTDIKTKAKKIEEAFNRIEEGSLQNVQ